MASAMISSQALRDSRDGNGDTCHIANLTADERTMLIEMAVKVGALPCRNQVVEKARELVALRLILAAQSDEEMDR